MRKMEQTHTLANRGIKYEQEEKNNKTAKENVGTGQHCRLQNLPLLSYFHKSGSSVSSQTDFSRYVAAFPHDQRSRTPEGC